MTRFTPKLGQDPAYMKDPDERSKPYEFTLSPAERDVAILARLDIERMKRASNQFVPGIVATELSPEDLTAAEREAFGL